jgi:putative addiction module killer protein
LTKRETNASRTGWKRSTLQPLPRVTIALTRMEQGNLSKTKSVGAGVYEYKIDFGPGYRIYFGRDGERIVILVGGGTKKRQNKDIQAAQAMLG